MKKDFAQRIAFFHLVAGAGTAPAPTGYEPVEVLFLHPAMSGYYIVFY